MKRIRRQHSPPLLLDLESGGGATTPRATTRLAARGIHSSALLISVSAHITISPWVSRRRLLLLSSLSAFTRPRRPQTCQSRSRKCSHGSGASWSNAAAIGISIEAYKRGAEPRPIVPSEYSLPPPQPPRRPAAPPSASTAS